MIERKFIQLVIREFQVREYVAKNIGRAGLSDVKLQRTPLGERIVVFAARPGLVVGRSGANISKLTKDLKKNFKLENPQIEIEEVQAPNLDANIVAEMIVGSLERFGSNRFKGIGHKAMQDVMTAGALGIEILISGKIPSSRAKKWRFYSGYLKKCGDVAITGVQRAYATANLKSGMVGVQVSIMPPTTKLPDRVTILDAPEPSPVVEEVAIATKPKRARTKKAKDTPQGIRVGETVSNSADAPITAGNVLSLAQIPEGTPIFNIEASPGDGGKFVRASGAAARIVTKTPAGVVIQFPSRKTKTFHPACRATIGLAAGGGRTDKPLMKAGAAHHKMRKKNLYYPKTQGTSMNAVAHPFGNKRSLRKSKARPAPKNAPPGRNVGMIHPRRTGRKRGTQ